MLKLTSLSGAEVDLLVAPSAISTMHRHGKQAAYTTMTAGEAVYQVRETPAYIALLKNVFYAAKWRDDTARPLFAFYRDGVPWVAYYNPEAHTVSEMIGTQATRDPDAVVANPAAL